MVKISSVFKFLILLCVTVLMGYLQIFNLPKNYFNLLQMIVAVIAIVLAISTNLIVSSKKITTKVRVRLLKEIKKLNVYVYPYTLIIAYEVLHTYLMYGYNKVTLFYATTPYLYVFFCYPLAYIFVIDKGYVTFLKKIAILGIVMTSIRIIGWYLYNFRGLYVIPGLVLQTTDWVRNGLQRIDAIPLFGVVTVYSVYKWVQTRRYRYAISVLMLILYPIVVIQVRYLSIVIIATVIVMLYLKPSNTANSAAIRTLMSLALIVIAIFGGLKQVLSLFSLNNEYAASTSVRFEAMSHFWILIKESHNFLAGLGFLSPWSSQAALLLQRNQWQDYYLSDLGIFGGLIVLGLLGILVYGLLYYIAIRSFKDSKIARQDDHLQIIIGGLLIYLILSCLSLNIFDMNRAIDVPFYLSIFSFTWSKYHHNLNTSVSENTQ